MACECVLEDLVKYITTELHSSLSYLENEGSRDALTVRKKTRDLKSGDIIVPAGCLKLNEVQVTKLLHSMQIQAGKTDGTIERVTSDKHSLLAFHLNRSKIYKDVLREIEKKGKKYGYSNIHHGQSVFINLTQSKGCGAAQEEYSLTDLRVHILQNHIKLLLEANGYTVLLKEGQVIDLSSLIIEANSEDSTSNPSALHQNENSVSSLKDNLIEKAKLFSSARKEEGEDSVGNNGDSKSKQTSAGEDISLDLRKIITDKGFYTGKDGFDKNLSHVTVLHEGKPTQLLEQVADLAGSLYTVAASGPVCGFLHVVPHNQGFRQQQVQLTLAALSEQQFKQSQLVVGPVTVKSVEASESGGVIDSASSFYQRRYEQMKEASEMRYGCVTEDEDGDSRVKLLTSASIKMDILGNAAHNPLCLETGCSDRGAESRLGSFVLYNTARLATLMEHFDHGVQKGMYPSLPSVADTDFSLLRGEEDWELLYLYIAQFPSMVSNAVESIFPEDGKSLAKIHTHKVTNFMTSFCKCLSAYYSRYHILTGGEKHLLPLMFARLHLMKASHQILVNSLGLIGVKALSYL